MCDSDKAGHAYRAARAILLAMFAVALLFGCMPYELKAVLDGPQGKPLSVSPSATAVIAGNTVNFSAAGGVGPYVYAFVSGSGTGTIDSTGAFHSISPGTAVIRVTDRTGKWVDATVTVQTAALGLTISPASITISVGQSFTFSGMGGTGPYLWTIQTPGSGSPSISPTGVYTAGNTPNTTDIVRLTDSTAAFVTATVTVKPPVVGLAISPTAINLSIGGTVTFGAAGGTGPYTWAIQTPGSGVPTISPTTGVYVAGNTPGTDVVRLTDSTAAFVTATVTVTPLLPLTISPTAINLSIGGTVSFVGIGGTAPYTWTIQTPGSGSPAISPTGVYVAGNTPNTTDIVRLTDAASVFVAATVTVTPLSSVDYTITGTSLSGAGTVATALTGGQTFALKNIGTSTGTASVNWTVYLSANTVLDGGDSVVASGTTPALGAGANNPAVPVVPGSFPAVAPGPYYLIVQITSADDTTPANNTSPAIPITLSPQNIDYISNPVSSTGPLMAGGAMTGDFTIKNQGSANGGAAVFWQVRASADTTFDATDYIVAGGSLPGGLNANTTSASINFSGSWPSTPGPWYLLAAVVSADDVNNLNNVSAATLVTTTGVAPTNVEYTVQTVTSSGGQTAGKPLAGSFTYRNNGTSAGAQSVFWTAYVSSDNVLQLGTDTVIDSGTVGPLGPAATSAPVPFSGTWPSTTGTWYLIVSISCSEDVIPTNNITPSLGIAVTAPNVNYDVPVVNSTGGITAGDPLTGKFTYHNGGLQDGSQSVVWTAYLSSDPVLQIGTDPVIDSGVVPPLAAGATSGTIPFAGTWPAGANPWYLIVSLTVAEDVVPGNNTTATTVPIATSQPNVDYTVFSVSNAGGTTAGGVLSGNVTLKNVGTHAGTQFVPWRAYLSTDAILQIGTDTLISSGFLSSPGLGPGASSAALPISGTWPSSSSVKTYYLIVEVGAGDDVFSGNNDGVSALVTVNPPDINYVVSVVNNSGGTSTGGPLTGNFTIHNNGVDNGVSTIAWTAHLSSDATLQVTDPVIATGSTGPLAGSGTSVVIPFAGTWPVTAGTWYLIVEANAADDTNPANNWTASVPIVVTSLAPNYVITAVPLPVGTQTGLAVSGNFTVKNLGTAAGATTVNWEVYASLGNNTYDAGDTLIAAGSFAPLGIAGTSSPGYAGTWPATAGTYYIIVRVYTADDAVIADVASAAIAVTAPPAPDYTASFNAAIPWSGLVGTAMSLTGTPQMTIQNLSVNAGHQNITWAVYLSTDNVLDAGDTLVQQGTIGPLAGSGSTSVSFAGNWPAAPGQLYFLIATVQATDDSNVTNNVVIAPHACAIGDYRYVEGAENNGGVGPNPPAGQTSNTGVTSLGANQTIAIEGVMDAYIGAVSQYDTYKFTTNATMSKLSSRARWGTGYDDIDLYLWDTGATNLDSIDVGINSEPGAGTFDVTSVTPRVCYISANFWLANNTSGSGGQKYVILVRGLP
jgi:hypothetical protein